MADQLTPEEKLLKVIQHGATAPGLIGSATAEVEDADTSDTDTIHEVRAGHEHFTGVGILIRGLILLAVLLFSAVCYEFYRAMPDPALVGREQAPPDSGGGETQLFPPYAVVLAEYQNGGIFKVIPDTPVTNRTDTVPGWARYIKRHFNWLGISKVTDASTGEVVLEAIVMDKKTGKLQLLREGNRLFISASPEEGTAQEVVLSTVVANELVFTAEGFELRLKKQ